MFLYELLETERVLAIEIKTLERICLLMTEADANGSLSFILHLTQGYSTLDEVYAALEERRQKIKKIYAQIRQLLS